MGKPRWLAPLIGGALALVLAVPALGQESYRVRGVVKALDGDNLIVLTRAGEVQGYPLAPDAGVYVARPATLDDVKTGAYVGLASVEEEKGPVALEAHVFAEDLRGVGEGHFPWDLVEQPNAMTNATVTKVETLGPERVVTVSYAMAEGEGQVARSQTITLPAGVPVVHLERAEGRDLLVPKAEVFVWVEAPRDGTPVASMVVVGRGGAVPPM